MLPITRRGLGLLGAAIVVALGAAAGTATAAPTQPVNLRFAAVAGSTPVRCGTPISGLGIGDTTAQLADLRFYVSNVSLVTTQGRAVPVTLAKNGFQTSKGADGVTLIDLENGSGDCSTDGTKPTNGSVRGTIPKGTYTGVRWTLGVPFALNHTDTVGATAPLNLMAMAWDWQFGRKFAKIELTDPAGAQGTWSTKAFLIHLGSTGCTGDAAKGKTVKCLAANQAAERFTHFDVHKQEVLLDLKALVAGDDITTNQADEPGCMSGPTDPECGPIFKNLGIAWNAKGKGTGSSPTGVPQTVFRAGAA